MQVWWWEESQVILGMKQMLLFLHIGRRCSRNALSYSTALTAFTAYIISLISSLSWCQYHMAQLAERVTNKDYTLCSVFMHWSMATNVAKVDYLQKAFSLETGCQVIGSLYWSVFCVSWLARSVGCEGHMACKQTESHPTCMLNVQVTLR